MAQRYDGDFDDRDEHFDDQYGGRARDPAWPGRRHRARDDEPDRSRHAGSRGEAEYPRFGGHPEWRGDEESERGRFASRGYEVRPYGRSFHPDEREEGGWSHGLSRDAREASRGWGEYRGEATRLGEPGRGRSYDVPLGGASGRRDHRDSDELSSSPGRTGFAADPRTGRHFGRGPKGYHRSDERIREDVCDRLTADPEVDARDLTVHVKDCEVTLEGTVSDRRMKRCAEDCAEDVPGVSQVHNRLRVRSGEESEKAETGNGRTAGAGRS